MFLHKVLLLLFFFSVLAADSLLAQPLNNKIDDQRYNFLKSTGEAFLRSGNLGSLPDDFEPDLTIDLRTIDTAIYSPLFTFFSEVPVASAIPLNIKDTNHDSRKEIFGSYYNYSSDPEYVIYEINKNGTYDSVFNYPDSLGPISSITDLDNDNFYEVATRSNTNSLNRYLSILSNESINGYPTNLKTIYDPSTGMGQITSVNFYDMDNDGFPELIYYLDGPGDSIVQGNSFHIAEYDRTNNSFNLVYQNRPSIYFSKGIGFGDFDSDGKQNFAVGNYLGEIFVYEYVQGNEYNVIRVDSVPISHVFLQVCTDDVDNNGKPELWIGGEGYINGVPTTYLYVYEAENDKYKITYIIAIIGVRSFFAYNIMAVDIDCDNTEEILICIDQHVLVFKRISSGYSLFYIKRNELLNLNSVYFSATAADLDGDNFPEIIISMDLIENQGEGGIFSRIYKKTSTVQVTDTNEDSFSGYSLGNSYPNPFNSLCSFKYSIGKPGLVSLKIFNILGKEIRTLLSDQLNRGKYTISWDGTDNNGNAVSSGIYFINLFSGTFLKTIKITLIK